MAGGLVHTGLLTASGEERHADGRQDDAGDHGGAERAQREGCASGNGVLQRRVDVRAHIAAVVNEPQNEDELCADGGAGDDAPSVVAGVGGDQPRPEHAKQRERARETPLRPFTGPCPLPFAGLAQRRARCAITANRSSTASRTSAWVCAKWDGCGTRSRCFMGVSHLESWGRLNRRHDSWERPLLNRGAIRRAEPDCDG
jgi:hypothetical protein